VFRPLEITQAIFMIQNKHAVLKNILLMIGFGIISIILSAIRFYLPDMDGGGTDMREIGVLLSAIFLPSWVYILGVSFIASINFPFNHLEISTILMHCTASLFAWFYYAYIRNKTENTYVLGGLWAIMVIAYYTIFLIPTMVLVFYALEVIDKSAIASMYKNVLFLFRFELFASASITTLFIVLYKTTRILKTRNQELERALLKSEESDRLKSAFLTNINHEIRTPLNGIVGGTRLIIEPSLSDEQRISYGNLILSSSDKLLTTVSNILELSKIKTGQIDICKTHVSIPELLNTIYQEHLPIAIEKKLQFEIIPINSNAKETIITDRIILSQILENLISNALKFTDQGGVRIKYQWQENFIVFQIEDTGSGIAQDYIDKIFDHFSKLDNDHDKLYEGIGLGLTIAKALVEIMGGTMQVKSEVDKGSMFSFTLPTGSQSI